MIRRHPSVDCVVDCCCVLVSALLLLRHPHNLVLAPLFRRDVHPRHHVQTLYFDADV